MDETKVRELLGELRNDILTLIDFVFMGNVSNYGDFNAVETFGKLHRELGIKPKKIKRYRRWTKKK